MTKIVFRDVSEFKFESKCCWNPTVFCKSEIRQIFRDIYVGFEFSTFLLESLFSSFIALYQ